MRVLFETHKISKYEISRNGDKSTILLTFHDGSVESRSYHILSLEAIKAMIENGEDICLDGCYVKDFSCKDIFDEKDAFLKNFSAQNTFFDGNTDFSRTSFGDGDISFADSIFADGNISFNISIFGKGDVSFNKAIFADGTVSFLSTDFGDGDVSFNGAEFGHGDVSFDFANFGLGGVSFDRTCFGNGTVSFDETNFGKGPVSFDNTYFGNGNVSFFDTHFNAKNEFLFDIFSAGFSTIIFSNCIFNGDLRFKNIHFDEMKFIDCTNKSILDINNIEYESPNKIFLKNMKNAGIIFFDWPKLKKALAAYEDEESEHLIKWKGEEMKVLKECFHQQGKYDWEDEAYVEFKRYERKNMTNAKRFGSFLLDFIGDYGTKPQKIFQSMIVTVIFFAFMYWSSLCHVVSSSGAGVLKIWHYLYYSVITFLTIGYGDLSAHNGFTAFCSGLEGFLGVLLMSYFSVALIRKTLR